VTAAPLELAVGGRSVTVSKPDKQLIPPGVTKADLARYHEAVAEAMLPFLDGRPLNLERYPDGIGKRPIFTQRIPGHFPDWIGRATVDTADGTATHVVARDAATLVYLANQAAVTLHGWGSRVDRIDRPDRLVIDLDPTRDDPSAVRRAAREMAALLTEIGLTPLVLATGSRGYHLVVPLQRRQTYDELRAFARDVGRLAVARDPEHLTQEFLKKNREDRIFVDTGRNRYGHTAVVPYSVRPREGAPVATPLAVDELADPHTRADRFTITTVLRRLGEDPWAGARPAALGAARNALDAALAEAA
jgi:bifunctional non-homologous end joining protein LigD